MKKKKIKLKVIGNYGGGIVRLMFMIATDLRQPLKQEIIMEQGLR